MTKLVDKLKEAIERSGYSMKSSAAASQAASIIQGYESDCDASENGHVQFVQFDVSRI